MNTVQVVLDSILWAIAIGFSTACILVLVSTNDIHKVSLAFLLMIIGLQAAYTEMAFKNIRLREELRRIKEAGF